MTVNWQPIEECLEEAKRIVLTTHASPDGDGVGSEIGLFHFLRARGKTVHILNPSAMGQEYQFLDEGGNVRVYKPVEHLHLVQNADAFIILDIGDYARLQKVGDHIKQSPGKTICIDHHPQTKHDFDHEIIDVESAATGMMVYHLIQHIDPDAMNFKIAQALYCALMTDTGSFRFSNTTSKTHRMAMKLLEFDVEPHNVYRNVYESSSVERMKLLGKVIENLEFSSDRRIAYFPVTLKMQEQVGASHQDVDGFTDFIRTLGEIEVAVMFHELNKQQTRINFRSKGSVVINQVAKHFDGGGHEFAAGAVIDKPYKKAIPIVIEEVEKAIDDYLDEQYRKEVEQAIS
ncbi:MAG: bifunctional oligoribonuclease/PAP phosphatase NrnA [Candidatus Marinimicrobia bacterium]|nr:bifunctional oligoribonuclease/PAP phosphatase NrnA [Candidatus Neomarinimicrobiota bacterium]MCF7829002.1 bifunctional oligoribonuclease/PAP phosphatase NrnA [Candidatus Neomarinimicrobiota bacterium]MCF7879962.1 bifunctional oligoribonuclease/PAP phosphatase NrnA [Candidatus Neomarinimicrobiota bacterium]